MKHDPEIVGIIPARFGSTRFPGKPLADIQGKTLIQHTYENALRCTLLDEIVVATDDQRIFDHVRAFGGRATMTSPHCLTGSDRLAEVVEKEPRYKNTAIIANIQGDEPFFDPQIIEKGVLALKNDVKAVVATAVTPFQPGLINNVNDVKCVFDNQGYALYFSRSLIPGNRTGQSKPEQAYYKHIGLYIFKRQFLLEYRRLPPTPLQTAEDLEQLKILESGFAIKVIVVNSFSLDVNVPEDIKKIEKELCKQNTSL